MSPVEVTFLNGIAGADFPAGLRKQAALGLTLLDIKDSLWGQRIEEIDEPTATRVAALVASENLRVDCLSTSIGCVSFRDGMTEAAFRATYDPLLANTLRTTGILRPRMVRLLLPAHLPRAAGESAFAAMHRTAPWVVDVYREWITRLAEIGVVPVLENEAHGCLFATPADIAAFFHALDHPAARYIWDVQNLWQMGVFPSLDAYAQLKPFIASLHLKGGRADTPGGPLIHAAALEDASWPVREIVHAVLADARVPVLCLNPSHGAKPADWDIWATAVRDLAYLRREFPQLQ
ncbi:MAG: TIM barrel protein [Burkholderiales bacterium]|nr:TIM barrel protein [Opitutaceae bacterium]